MMTDRILLIRTGGTIDAEPYDNPYQPPHHVSTLPASESLIEQTVRDMKGAEKVDHFRWLTPQEESQFVKDSQLFSDADIMQLAELIARDDHHNIIITHGTDAMAQNASALKEALGNTDKTIIFTGAMIPLSMNAQYQSDGITGLQFSLNNIESQDAGVFVAARDQHTKRMDFFAPERIEKDRVTSKAELEFTVSQCSR